jgi:hypothetical protein
MFKEVGMESCGSEVRKYIYATTPDITNIILVNNSSGQLIG